MIKKHLEGIRNILWDFDGVILNSNAVRDKGFEITLQKYPSEQVEKLMKYHQENGGLSRYHKFRYFFETIRNEKVTDERILKLANEFSVIMMKNLTNKSLLIRDSLEFIISNHLNYCFHIVSGSDGKELNNLCKHLEIDSYFLSIQGSPTPKKELVDIVLKKYQYSNDECILIGDSINDFEAAVSNKIKFLGYNSKTLKEIFPENYTDILVQLH
jgi:HAD superfamily hydrolase (TIGR01549 family)